MTDQPRLLDAYRRAHEVLSPVPRPDPSTAPTEATKPPWTTMAAKLEEAGWDWTVRMGKRIWCKSRDDPLSGWKSEEMAYMWMRRGER